MRTPLDRPLPRRRFLQLGGLAAAEAALGRWPELGLSASPPLDLLLRGGTVVDGTGAPPFRADVGVKDGRIAAVGLLPDAQASEVLEVTDRIVAPGFIDIHGHTDLGILVDNRADSKVRQGVTTEVVGQDGSSVLPVSDRMRAERRADHLERYGTPVDFGTWDEWFRLLSVKGHLTNWVTLVGSGTVREAVIGGENRPPTREEMAAMIALVEAALAAGAAGVSSGLEYTPNAFAEPRELALLARPAAGRALPYATHMRNEADRVEEALAEAITVAEAAGAPLLVSHLKTQGPAPGSLRSLPLHRLLDRPRVALPRVGQGRRDRSLPGPARRPRGGAEAAGRRGRGDRDDGVLGRDPDRERGRRGARGGRRTPARGVRRRARGGPLRRDGEPHHSVG